MDLGDAAIVDKNGKDIVLLERKKLSDLASSIKDGRYAEQSYRLNGYPLHNHNIVYLIEGNVSQYNDKWTRVKPSTLYTTMFSLQYCYQRHVIFITMELFLLVDFEKFSFFPRN